MELTQALYAVPRDRMPNGIQYRNYVESDRDEYGESTLGLRPKFAPDREVLQRTRKQLVRGDRLKLHYAYVSDTDLERVEATLRAVAVRGRPALKVVRAMLLSQPADSDRDEPGLTRLE